MKTLREFLEEAKLVEATEEVVEDTQLDEGVTQIHEASKPEYHYYATTVLGPGKQEGRKLLHPENRPFYSERDAFMTIRSHHRGEGTIHKVQAKTGKIVSNRTVHGGEAAYENTPEAGQPTHKSHFVESTQLDEAADIELKPHENGTHYIVHKIHPSSGIESDQLDRGQKLNDTNVDDLKHMGYKIKIHPK